MRTWLADYRIVNPASEAIDFLPAGDEDYDAPPAAASLQCTPPGGCQCAIAQARVLR